MQTKITPHQEKPRVFQALSKSFTHALLPLHALQTILINNNRGLNNRTSSSSHWLKQMKTLKLFLAENEHGTVYSQIAQTPRCAAIHKLVVVGDELEGFYEPCVPLQHAFLRLITRPIPSRLRLEHITVLEFERVSLVVHSKLRGTSLLRLQAASEYLQQLD
eukprot:1154673-Pelagomonas_calceolata.AAC.4